MSANSIFDQDRYLTERLWDKVLFEPHGCWEWSAGRLNGYGVMSLDNQNHYAHRVAYESEIGPIPEGLVIDHLCRNRWCVRPDHLEPVTRAENTRRARAAEKEALQSPL